VLDKSWTNPISAEKINAHKRLNKAIYELSDEDDPRLTKGELVYFGNAFGVVAYFKR